MRRGSGITALVLVSCCLLSLLSSTSGSIPWPSWIPGPGTNLGWSIKPGTNTTYLIPNPIFNEINGSANDTIMYSYDLVSIDSDILLVNYIDLENTTSSQFTSNPFSQSISQTYRNGLNQKIKQYTNATFSGSTVWDLVVFTFTEIWNERLSAFMITPSEVKIGGHQGVLLDYGGNTGLGCIAFVNIGTKIGLVFNVARNSTWKNATVFSRSIQAFVTAFLAPLEDIMYAAYFDELSIIASGIAPLARSISIAQGSSFLNHTAFLAIVDPLMALVVEKSYPFRLTWNQILLIVAIAIIILIVIFYGITSFKKEKKTLPESVTATSRHEIPF